MEDMMDPRTLLVYGMNGETLPVEHGFPLRIYIPDSYGMKQPKWITDKFRENVVCSQLFSSLAMQQRHRLS